MDYDKLLRRCLHQTHLATMLAGKMDIPPTQTPRVFSGFENIKREFENCPRPYRNEDLIKKMAKTAHSFEEYYYLFRIAGGISHDLQNEMLRAMAKTARTFDENFVVYVKSIGQPNVVSSQRVLADLALIGTFEDWLTVYFEHRGIFDSRQFNKVAIASMAKILESER